jgi:hypothetical protein
MVICTTLITPPALKWSFERASRGLRADAAAIANAPRTRHTSGITQPPVHAIAASKSAAALADRAGAMATVALAWRARRMNEDHWNMGGPRKGRKVSPGSGRNNPVCADSGKRENCSRHRARLCVEPVFER